MKATEQYFLHGPVYYAVHSAFESDDGILHCNNSSKSKATEKYYSMVLFVS